MLLTSAGGRTSCLTGATAGRTRTYPAPSSDIKSCFTIVTLVPQSPRFSRVRLLNLGGGPWTGAPPPVVPIRIIVDIGRSTRSWQAATSHYLAARSRANGGPLWGVRDPWLRVPYYATLVVAFYDSKQGLLSPSFLPPATGVLISNSITSKCQQLFLEINL